MHCATVSPSPPCGSASFFTEVAHIITALRSTWMSLPIPKQHTIWHLQTEPVFKNKISPDRTVSVHCGRRCYCECCKNILHTPPATYPTHARNGSRRKKLEQIFDCSFFRQSTVPYTLFRGRVRCFSPHSLVKPSDLITQLHF